MSTEVCWHIPWGRCSKRHYEDLHFYYGRCRSGRRWFWAVSEWDGDHAHGWVDSEAEALDQARTAVVRLAAGRAATAFIKHGHASACLKDINTEKRKQRPASTEFDTAPVEYLYGQWQDEECERHTVAFRVTKRTPKRVYYIRQDYGDGDIEVGFVDRQALERDGYAHNRGAGGWWAADFTLYTEPPTRKDSSAGPDLQQLKDEMVAAHPDRGGDHETFIQAHRRYMRAKQRTSPATSKERP
jgi:hypothetical protein